MSHPEWQSQIRHRLMANQTQAESVRSIIDQYRRLGKTARDLRVRNKALLKTRGTGDDRGGGGSGDSNTLLAHLDSQLTSLRTELSSVHRAQASNQNKQLALSDALRDRDEEVMRLREDLRALREVKEKGERKEREWEEKWRLREEDIQTMADEIMSLNLELTAVSERNDDLMHDNANLLQRWIDKMNLMADDMNDQFEQEFAATGQGDDDDGFEEVEVFVDAPDTTPLSSSPATTLEATGSSTRAAPKGKIRAPTSRSQSPGIIPPQRKGPTPSNIPPQKKTPAPSVVSPQTKPSTPSVTARQPQSTAKPTETKPRPSRSSMPSRPSAAASTTSTRTPRPPIPPQPIG